MNHALVTYTVLTPNSFSLRLAAVEILPQGHLHLQEEPQGQLAVALLEPTAAKRACRGRPFRVVAQAPLLQGQAQAREVGPAAKCNTQAVRRLEPPREAGRQAGRQAGTATHRCQRAEASLVRIHRFPWLPLQQRRTRSIIAQCRHCRWRYRSWRRCRVTPTARQRSQPSFQIVHWCRCWRRWQCWWRRWSWSWCRCIPTARQRS